MEIQPDKQNLDQTFATTVYFIDFYQRDYKWAEEPVRRLLDDVFYQFEETYNKHPDLAPNKENINVRPLLPLSVGSHQLVRRHTSRMDGFRGNK